MAQETIVFPERATSSPGFDRHETLLTPGDLKVRYLHGVDLNDDKANPLPDEMIQFAIDSAISLLEHDLEITISPTEYKESHDYKMEDYWNWGIIQLNHKPIIGVPEVKLVVVPDPDGEPNQGIVTFPKNWIRTSPMNGQIQIAPVSGSIGEFNIGQVMFLPRLLVFNQTFPNFFHVTYTSGFEQDKIPKIISQVIGLIAAIDVLAIAGDLILGAGVASTSIGIDGLSQSVTSTASAENLAYSARIKLYQTKLKEAMGTLRKYYGKKVKHTIC